MKNEHSDLGSRLTNVFLQRRRLIVSSSHDGYAAREDIRRGGERVGYTSDESEHGSRCPRLGDGKKALAAERTLARAPRPRAARLRTRLNNVE